MPPAFAIELDAYGPAATAHRQRITLAEAQHYCERLAKSHYENFTVASWLLPREIRPHFHSIYAYCRWADDLADETAGGRESIQLLDWWETELEACYRGDVRHPVFVALRATIDQFAIPMDPFRDLLIAFRQDQYRKRYDTFNELLDYCRNSANPVGRLVLYLGRVHRPKTVAYSDSICTGLQLANFCQDVKRDYQKGRIYLPQEDCRAVGYGPDMFAGQEYNRPFESLLSGQVARAEAMLGDGKPLVELVPDWLRLEVALFIGGGLAILEQIRRQRYNVWRRRPTVGKLRKLRLLAGAWGQSRRQR
jgi:squalene synthase HpnC